MPGAGFASAAFVLCSSVQLTVAQSEFVRSSPDFPNARFATTDTCKIHHFVRQTQLLLAVLTKSASLSAGLQSDQRLVEEDQARLEEVRFDALPVPTELGRQSVSSHLQLLLVQVKLLQVFQRLLHFLHLGVLGDNPLDFVV